MIDFQRVASAALSHAEALLCELFPAGRRDGHEFCIGGLSGEAGRSLKVNIRTGRWCDFASGDKGADLINLWAAARNMDQGEAAREIEERVKSGGLTARAPVAGSSTQSDPSEWTPEPFAPVDQPPPSVKRRRVDDQWEEAPVVASWRYVDAQGRPVGYVCRVQWPEGKDVYPWTYCRHTSGRAEWRWKGFARPRPLYRLPELAARPDLPVLVVEGEKTADAAARMLPGMVVVSWPGGCKAVTLADWSALQGRKVRLWPDADEAGAKAMAKIAELVPGAVLVRPPAGVKEGWDLADAEAEGWTSAQVVAHAKANMIEPGAQTDEPPPHPSDDAPLPEDPDAGDPVDEIPPPPPPKGEPVPFRCLGHDQGRHYFLPAGTRQVVDIEGKSLQKSALLTLAPLWFWSSNFPGDKGPDWTSAQNSVLRSSERVGIYDPRRLRGRGAWIDGERVVIHGGDRLIVDGVEASMDGIETRHIYQAATRVEFGSAAPAAAAQSAKLLELCQLFSWRDPLSAYFLAGWCVLAPVCGVLAWRPHIWLNGPSSAGKSWVLNNVVRPILGEPCQTFQSATTEAGIRQTLRADALPVLFDEAESEGKSDVERIQRILVLARAASTDDGANIVKGSASGQAMDYVTRSCFAFASIGVAAVQKADRSRITSLELKKFSGPEEETRFARIKALAAETVHNADYVDAIRARSISLALTIRQNARTFARAVASFLGDNRQGDQLGALLAGAYALTSSKLIDLEAAKDWVDARDWSGYALAEVDTDEVRALSHLLDAHLRLEDGHGPAQTRTVGELVAQAYDIAMTDSERKDARSALIRHGVKCDTEGVVISHHHQALRKIFSETPWANKWKDQLSRINGAVEIRSVRYGASVHRGTRVPKEVFSSRD